MLDLFGEIIFHNKWFLTDMVVTNGKIENIYFQDNKEHPFVIGCLTAPHKGNDNLYMLRYEVVYHFDRWSNAVFETYYRPDEAGKEALKEGLTKETAYKVLLRIYSAED